ncbi:MAG TPA: fluoride efflux transporter CrcB [Capillimicrobium sp.]|nr:fluoride efflux transporter CrcB [Capillimicrobium sp.]
MVGVLTWVGAAVLGALGALARFHVDAAVSARLATRFPLGTFVVNLSGSFALGVLVGLEPGDDVLFVLGTGFTGGYTTFSTWMVESARLGETGELPALVANLGLSMLLGLGIAAAGFHVGQAIA